MRTAIPETEEGDSEHPILKSRRLREEARRAQERLAAAAARMADYREYMRRLQEEARRLVR